MTKIPCKVFMCLLIVIFAPLIIPAFAAEPVVVIVSDYESFYKQLSGTNDVIRLADNFPTDTPGGFAIRTVKRKNNLIIEGNQRTIENFFLIWMPNLTLTIRDAAIHTSITSHPVEDNEHLEFRAVLEVSGGTLVMEDVRMYFSEAIDTVWARIDAVYIGESASARIFRSELTGSNRTVANGGNALSCYGQVEITDIDLLGGNVIKEYPGQNTKGKGLYVADNANVTVEGALIKSGATAVVAEGGTISVKNSTISSADDSPALRVSGGARFIFEDDRSIVSWPLYEGDGVGIEGIAQSVSFDEEAFTIAEGDELTLSPIFLPLGYYAPVRWHSSDREIAPVSNDGLVFGKTAGEAEISVELPGGAVAAVKITVKEPDPPDQPDPPDPEDDGEPPDSEKLADKIFYEFAQTYPDLMPPPKRMEAMTDIYLHEFIEDTPIYTRRNSGREPVGAGVKGDFAQVMDLEDEWAQIKWEGGVGYVPYDALHRFHCTLEETPVSAVFMREQGIYDRPGGKLLSTVPIDTLTKSIATRGRWTALRHEGELVYSPAEGLRLLILEPEYVYIAEESAMLFLEPYEDAEIVAAVAPGSRLEIVIEDGDREGWILIRIGSFTGYIESGFLEFPKDEEAPELSGNLAD